MNYPYGIHCAMVRLDRDTGGVAIERYFVAYDIGKAVNPMLVEGQITGGVAQGIGGALYEEFRYDDHGEPLWVNFADYLIPTALEIPPVDVLITEDAPSPLNPLGLKGAGEGGANAARRDRGCDRRRARPCRSGARIAGNAGTATRAVADNMTMRLTIRVDFGAGRSIGPGKIRLLEAIRRTGSISNAGRSLGMSYRRAWLLIDDLNGCFREPVVAAKPGGARGGGAELTRFGLELTKQYRAIEAGRPRQAPMHWPICGRPCAGAPRRQIRARPRFVQPIPAVLLPPAKPRVAHRIRINAAQRISHANRARITSNGEPSWRPPDRPPSASTSSSLMSSCH